MRQFELQKNQRIMNDEIISGRDELGVLLMGHDFKSWWCGSILDIERARKLVPHQNATTLQVAVSVVSAAIWMIKNPKRGFCMPDDIDHEAILEVSMPYIEPFISEAVDWTPLKNLNTKFTKFDINKPKEEDVWQFTTFLIDQGHVTLGYPKLTLSGGKDALIKVKYSEALYDEQNRKGNRNETEGKVIKGISDVYLMDGGLGRVFQPIWFRTFRFVQIEVETQSEPLTINDFHNIFSAARIPVIASFKTDDPIYRQVWDICWHTMKICAQDNLLSDAYYEQMQYVGDLRPHLKGWTALTGDLTYFRSAMEQFNNSRLPDGNITSCYPLKATFVHPTYSLMWIDMLHDLMMLEGNKAWIESYVGEIQEVFDYYESLINENGLVGKSEYQMFIDWYLPRGGNSEVNRDGNSAILTLNYAYTLNDAADIMEWLGYREKAAFYRNQGRKYAAV